MDDKSYNVRIPKRWVRVAMIVGATALVVAPLTAIASHSFTDVPNSNIFHSDIEWLADAGVTKGCNPPVNSQFCPKDNVTREAMSAFMRRFAQYIDAEDGTPAQADNAATAGDADSLDGLDSSDLVRVEGAVDSGDVDNWNGSSDLTTSVNVSAPTDGFLLINFDVDLAKDAGETGAGFGEGTMTVELDGAQQNGTNWWGFDFDESGFATKGFSMQRLVPVTAGTYTIDGILGGASAPTAARLVYVYDRTLTVLFVPFDGAGLGPAALSSGGSPEGKSQSQP